MSRSPRIDDLFAVTRPQDPTISPDGSQVVFVHTAVDRDGDRQVTELRAVAATGGEPRRLTCGPADSSPAFSPDGSRLAFLRAEDGPGQLWLLPTDGGDARSVTSLPWGAGAPVWSPDGSRLAFTAPVGPDGLEPGDFASAPVVADDLDYQADGTKFLGRLRQQLHVLDVATERVRRLTSGKGHVTSPVWDASGERLYVATAVGDDADMTMHTATHVVDVEAPGSGRPLPATGLGYEVPMALHPGGDLLCIGSREPGVGHTGVWLRGVDTTELRDLTGHLDRNVMGGAPGYPGATPGVAGEDLLVCVRERGYTNLLRVAAGGGAEPVVGGDATVAGMSLSADGTRAALVLLTPESFGEVAVLELADDRLTQLTSYRSSLLDQLDWVTPQERTFTAPDGRQVHGWVVRRGDTEGPSPLLLDIHGGPHNAWSGTADAEHLYHQVLAAAGWSVLLLNPRASDGYGEDFYSAAIGQWGIADADDFLAPIDTLVEEGLADPDRLAVTGYSYGGYMTCYLTSRDDRFAAAVPGGIVADTHSVSTTSDMGLFLATKELGGLPWERREHFDHMSPMHLVERVSTPTLILHGADDVRCPVSEAQRWFTALRTRSVPSQLVLYPGASHLFVLNGRPSHRADWNGRIVDWVNRHAGGGARAAARPALEPAHWENRLGELVARHEVPGAALGILRLGAAPGGADEVFTAAAGVLNQATGHRVGPDSVFQIGSVTKVWTATLVMQLVDEGRLHLDAPVRDVLPELQLADESVAERVTLRHLLTHTSGIDGDIFTDTGRGDDCLERYVAQLGEARQLHPLGETFSYCNSGFNLIGRMIEKVTGKVWDEVLRERLVTPLGLQRTGTLPEEALLFDAALGHERGDDGILRPVRQWGIPRSAGPAGLVSARVQDVLEFAAMHLRGGVAADGTRLLSETSVRAMQEEQVVLPGRHDLGDSWGLGWIRFGWSGERLFGHDGNTIGQSAFLRVLPREGLVVALLTNGGNTPDLFRSLYGEIFTSLAGVELPEPLIPREVPVALDGFTGTYERAAERIEVSDSDGIPTLTSTRLGGLQHDGDPVTEYRLHGFEEDTALIRPPELESWSPVTFYRTDSGARYVHHHLRATPRTEQEPATADR